MEFLTSNSSPPSAVPTLPTIGRILCCLCGASIIPNEAAMCEPCLHQQHDLSTQIKTQLEINQCRKCTRWQVGSQDSSSWANHELESNGLLMLCLKKIPELQGSSDLKILNSTWIWTEPHSKRLKFFVDLEKMLFVSTKFSIQQKLLFEFVIKNKQCIDCIHNATEHNFQSVLQLRQFAFVSSYGSNSSHSSSSHNAHNHKKILYTIENFCTKYRLFDFMTNLEIVKDNGYNFYFKNKQYCEKVVHLLTTHFPIYFNHNKISKKLVSRNLHTNTARYEYTYLLELLPYNKDDLVLLPPAYSGQTELMIITKTTALLHCIQPLTLCSLEISTLRYATQPCVLLATAKHLVSFVVLDVTPCHHNPFEAADKCGLGLTPQQKGRTQRRDKKKQAKQQQAGGGPGGSCGPGGDSSTNHSLASRMTSVKHDGGLLADIVVAKESDLGENDVTYTIRSHLGHLLVAGDTVLGYDLQHMVFGLEQETKLAALPYALPDIVLVKKVFQDEAGLSRPRRKNNRPPPWRRQAPAPAPADTTEEVEGAGEEQEEEEEDLLYDEEGLEEVLDEAVAEEVAILAAIQEEEEDGEGEEGGAEEEDEGVWEDVDEDEEVVEEVKAEKPKKAPKKK